LKKAAEGIIPDEVIWRKKQGFGTPIAEWLKQNSSISKEMTNIILNSNLRKRNILNYDYIENLIRSHHNKNTDQSFKIWNLITLSLWYDYWFD
jgi:asparagine synthase (glutamine-hydrolysing)